MGFMLRRDPPGQRDITGNLDKVDFVRETEAVWIDGRLRLVSLPAIGNRPGRLSLYDIFADPAFKDDLAAKLPDDVRRMRKALDEWRASARASFEGKDYR